MTPPLFLISSIGLGALGQVLFKIGVEAIEEEGAAFYLRLPTSLPVLAGFFCYGVSFLLWMKVLKYYDVGFARPVTAVGYIVTYFLAVKLTGEPLSLWRIAGIVLIMAGVVLLSVKS